MLGMGPHSGSIHHKQNVTPIIIKQKDEPSLKRGNEEVDQNSDEVEHFRIISYKSQAVKLICFNQLSQEKIEDSLAMADNSLKEKQ